MASICTKSASLENCVQGRIPMNANETGIVIGHAGKHEIGGSDVTALRGCCPYCHPKLLGAMARLHSDNLRGSGSATR
jgi:hypothetical protein